MYISIGISLNTWSLWILSIFGVMTISGNTIQVPRIRDASDLQNDLRQKKQHTKQGNQEKKEKPCEPDKVEVNDNLGKYLDEMV